MILSLGAGVGMAAALLATWGRLTHSGPYTAQYEYINSSLVFTGDPSFQSLVINFNLTADHLSLAAAAVLAAVTLGAVAWNRTGGRNEVGPIRVLVLAALLLFAAVGVVFSIDLFELATFWGIAGACTYLLLAGRWGGEASAPARLALALPFLTDLALVGGVALLYSRFGATDITKITPVLHATVGTGLKSVTAAAILIAVGAAGRAGLIPFHRWQTETSVGPPFAVALAQAVWPLLAAMLLIRTLPIFQGAGPQALTVLAVAGVAAALVGALMALFGGRLRVTVTAVGIAQSGLVFLALAHGLPAVAIAAAMAAAPARAAAVFAAAAISRALRTEDVLLLAEAGRRMRRAATILGLALGAMVVASIEAGARNLDPGIWEILYGAGLVLTAAAAAAVYVRTAHGTLVRRRAFEPDRIRDVVSGAFRGPAVLAALAAILAIATFVPGWLGYIDERSHSAASLAASAVWILVPLAGAALAAAYFGTQRSAALGFGSTIRASVAPAAAGWRALDAGGVRPGLAVGETVDGPLIDAGEETLGRGAVGAGAHVAHRVPLLPALIGLAGALALLGALLLPGVTR